MDVDVDVEVFGINQIRIRFILIKLLPMSAITRFVSLCSAHQKIPSSYETDKVSQLECVNKADLVETHTHSLAHTVNMNTDGWMDRIEDWKGTGKEKIIMNWNAHHRTQAKRADKRERIHFQSSDYIVCRICI